MDRFHLGYLRRVIGYQYEGNILLPNDNIRTDFEEGRHYAFVSYDNNIRVMNNNQMIANAVIARMHVEGYQIEEDAQRLNHRIVLTITDNIQIENQPHRIEDTIGLMGYLIDTLRLPMETLFLVEYTLNESQEIYEARREMERLRTERELYDQHLNERNLEINHLNTRLQQLRLNERNNRNHLIFIQNQMRDIQNRLIVNNP